METAGVEPASRNFTKAHTYKSIQPVFPLPSRLAKKIAVERFRVHTDGSPVTLSVYPGR